MADKKETKIFKFEAGTITAKKMRDCKVKVSILRAVDAEKIEGLCELFKLLTGRDDAFVDEITLQDMNSVIIWATKF